MEIEIENLTSNAIQFVVVAKEYQDKKPEHKLSAHEDFSKRWQVFLKGTNIENWKDHDTNYLVEKYR